MSFYVSVGPRGILFQVGMIWTGMMGSLTYWWTNRRRPAMPVPQSLPRSSGWSKQSMIRQSDESCTRRDEFERIRRACVDLGADEEMTELVLASHCQNRTLLDDMVANGDDLRDYVQYKLAIWEAILNEDEMSTLLLHNGAAGAIPASKLDGLGDPGACEPSAGQRIARSGRRAATHRGTGATDARPRPAPSPTGLTQHGKRSRRWFHDRPPIAQLEYQKELTQNYVGQFGPALPGRIVSLG